MYMYVHKNQDTLLVKYSTHKHPIIFPNTVCCFPYNFRFLGQKAQEDRGVPVPTVYILWLVPFFLFFLICSFSFFLRFNREIAS